MQKQENVLKNNILQTLEFAGCHYLTMQELQQVADKTKLKKHILLREEVMHTCRVVGNLEPVVQKLEQDATTLKIRLAKLCQEELGY